MGANKARSVCLRYIIAFINCKSSSMVFFAEETGQGTLNTFFYYFRELYFHLIIV